MKPAREEDQSGLDSLLDTLSNVVGILVIVLIVVQLSMSQTVKRITSSERVEPAAVERARSELAAVERQREELSAQIESRSFDPEQAERELARLRKAIVDEQADLRNLEAARRQAEEELQAAAAQARKQIDEQNQERRELEQTARRVQDELARLELQLKSSPVPEAQPAKVVTLPDPRPAPEGARPVTIFCWGGKVYTANLEELRERARKRFAHVVVSNRLDRDQAAGLDAKAVLAEFNKAPLRDATFDVELVARRAHPYLKLEPKESAGETVEQIQRSTSDYYRRLRLIARGNHYARFIVWADSFETYIVARRVAEEAGVMAGWQFIGQPPHYHYWIGGGKYRFGPPPQRDPKAKPKPKPEEKPPAPVDEID